MWHAFSQAKTDRQRNEFKHYGISLNNLMAESSKMIRRNYAVDAGTTMIQRLLRYRYIHVYEVMDGRMPPPT